MGRLIAGAAALVILVGAGAGCTQTTRSYRPPNATNGDAEIGRRLIADYGCGSCHQIPGVRGANGLVGPSLSHMGQRSFIAGVLANNQANMVRWLMNPPRVDPKTAMPDLHVTRADAQNMAAYLAGLD